MITPNEGAGAVPISVSAGFAADAETNLKFSHSNDPASSRGRLADVGLRLNDDEDPIPPSREFQRPPPSAPPALNYAPGGPSVTTSLLAAAVPVGAGAGSATVVTVGSTMPVETAFIAAGAPSAPPVVVYANYSPGFAMPRDPRIDDSRSHVHWRSLFISAGLWASLIAMIVFLCTRSSSSSSSSSTYGSPSTITPELTASFVCVGIFTLIYLIEVCISDTRKFLSNRLSVGSAEDYVRRVYTTPPQPVFWIQCYHYETRVHTTTHRDSKGNTRTQTHTTRVRVDTYSERKPFAFDLWRDVSDPMPLIRGYPLTKLHCGKTLVFADALSRARFDGAHAELVARNRHRDVHYETGWKLEVNGFESHVLASADGSVTPCGVSLEIYIVVSLLGLSYPYRLWLERKSVRASYRFTKEVRCLS